MRRVGVAIIASSAVIVASMSVPSPALAAGVSLVPITDPEIETPTDVVMEPDGGIWFTNAGNSTIGHVTTSGVVTYTDADHEVSGVFHLVLGPDGNVWFTSRDTDRIGRLDPQAPTVPEEITTFTAAGVDGPEVMTVGPGERIWFASELAGRLGRVTMAGAIRTFPIDTAVFGAGVFVTDMVAGPDGAIWFVTTQGDLGRFDRATRTFTSIHLGLEAYSVTVGPDGNLWALGLDDDGFSTFFRVSPSGSRTAFRDRGAPSCWGSGSDLVAGPDGNVWATCGQTDRLARVTMNGFVTGYTDPGVALGYPEGISGGSGDFLAVASPTNDTVAAFDATFFNPHNFTDVPAGARYGFALQWARHHGVVGGTTFRPRDAIRRREVVPMLWHQVDEPAGAPHGFTDVPAGVSYGPALDWAATAGVVTGGRFRPDASLTRGALALMLWRLMARPGGSPPHGFTDVPATGDLASAVSFVRAHRLIGGLPGNEFRPGSTVTRSQAVQVLAKLSLDAGSWDAYGPVPSTIQF